MTRAARLLAAGYGAYLLHAFWTGALPFYIHPMYVAPAVATGAVLLALAVVAGPRRVSRAQDGRTRPSRAGLAVLALPLAAGFLLPPQPLSYVTAAQRGVQALTASRGDTPPAPRTGGRPETFTILDWVLAFQADPEPGRHAGKPVRVTGFVLRDDRLPPDVFLVARFLLTCCAVDAQPLGLPVRAGAARMPDAGRWVTVDGIWDVTEIAGTRRAVILPRSVEPTARPEEPYLY
jgi:putative membrane protein